MLLRERPLRLDPARLPLEPFWAELLARRLDRPEELSQRWQDLLPPRLKDMDAAVQRIADAVARRELILIYGDYDVDGTCATALLYRVLQHCGARVAYFIPHRRRHGYGLNPRGLAEVLAGPRPDLIITVDNGTAAHRGAEQLRQLGIDLIITDHHLGDGPLPPAVAVLNPNRPDEDFPSKNLAGVGVAFYLAWALRDHFGFAAKVSDLLDWVALGTVADIVPLDWNNRILLHHGLRRLRRGDNIGLRALAAVAGVDLARASCADIGFALAPRLNAGGRLGDMGDSLRLLLSADEDEALWLARQLDATNRRRKELEQEQLARIEPGPEPLLAVYQPDGHEGLSGIVAARLKTTYRRPALVATDGEAGWIKGSLRAPAALSVKELLDAGAAALKLPPDSLIYGGHRGAGGFSIRAEYYEAFRAALNAAVPPTVEEVWEHDGPLPPAAFNLATAEALALQPWGEGFPAPLWANRCRLSDHRPLSGGHCRFTAQLPTGECFPAVYFNHAPASLPSEALLLFQLDINRYQGRASLQLLVRGLG